MEAEKCTFLSLVLSPTVTKRSPTLPILRTLKEMVAEVGSPESVGSKINDNNVNFDLHRASIVWYECSRVWHAVCNKKFNTVKLLRRTPSISPGFS